MGKNFVFGCFRFFLLCSTQNEVLHRKIGLGRVMYSHFRPFSRNSNDLKKIPESTKISLKFVRIYTNLTQQLTQSSNVRYMKSRDLGSKYLFFS